MLNISEAVFKKFLIFLAFILFSVFVIGIFWLTTNPMQTVPVALAYAAGLSMIVLPCTLPLLFVIVMLSSGKGYKKGLFVALLFGIGLTITITTYGVFTAALGRFLGLDQATLVMFAVAGLAAFFFGLSELKLVKFSIPAFRGGALQFAQRQGDYLKAFFLGLFLGNAGVGCPNPAFYVLLAYIASVGDLFTGAYLGFIHGIGRATPLIFLSIAAILGISATRGLTRRRFTIERLLGFGLIFVGSFIFNYGVFGMNWWELGPIHDPWNQAIESIFGRSIAESEALEEELGIIGWGLLPQALGDRYPIFFDIRIHWGILSSMMIIPFVWYRLKRYDRA